MNVLDLFSGIGGFSLGLERAGMRTIAFCEIDPFCRSVLAKHWPDVPIYEDVREITSERLRRDGIAADVITGGFPCQDISVAGYRTGIADGTRSGLWSDLLRIIREIRPKYAIVENVANLLSGPAEQPGGWFGRVLGDLAEIRFDAEWSVVSMCALGAPHMRRRVFIVAYPHSIDGRPRLRNSLTQPIRSLSAIGDFESARSGWRARLENPSELYRNADGVAFGMDRNRAIGNSIHWRIPEIIGRAIMQAEGLA